ncbi:MAG: T9SS type A sorting domain-containing protein, partial [Bacteroidota bacterium]
ESPAGGTFSGNSVSGSNFDASVGAGTYLITYTITDSISGCANSASQNMFVDACLGLETSNIANYNIYPNPNNGQFFIESANYSGKLIAEVFNAQGKLIYSEQFNSSYRNTVSIGEFSNGIYLLRLTQNNEVKFFKVTMTR